MIKIWQPSFETLNKMCNLGNRLSLPREKNSVINVKNTTTFP